MGGGVSGNSDQALRGCGKVLKYGVANRVSDFREDLGRAQISSFWKLSGTRVPDKKSRLLHSHTAFCGSSHGRFRKRLKQHPPRHGRVRKDVQLSDDEEAGSCCAVSRRRAVPLFASAGWQLLLVTAPHRRRPRYAASRKLLHLCEFVARHSKHIRY